MSRDALIAPPLLSQPTAAMTGDNAVKKWDLILVGGGLANGLIALRLRQQRPELNILLLESASQPGADHTWSFHQRDLSSARLAWLTPLIAHRWEGYDVTFPQLSRTLPGAYLCVTADRFAQVIRQVLGDSLQTQSAVTQVMPQQVMLGDGRTLLAHATLDGRGWQPDPYLTVGWQTFSGQQWRLASPHGLTRPILMDATVDQFQGYRFIYTLPLSPDTLLIEDTRYIDEGTLECRAAQDGIAAYAAARGWRLQTLEREEQGRLPVTLAGHPRNFWQSRAGQPCSGLRAGLFHPTTGYSLPLAAALADCIAALPNLASQPLFTAIRDFADVQWRRQRFFRLLNRMLFLAGSPAQRWQIMQRFYQLDASLIARFYAGEPTLLDMARVLVGRPPVPPAAALRAVLKHSPRLRAFR